MSAFLEGMSILAASGPDLGAARAQMALSLGWHIVIACLGVGFPVLIVLAEWRANRTGDVVYRTIARRWAKALAVLFAVGAVSGTILSFEFGILWPGLMGAYGSVIGLPFALEAFAFFIEAIFLGVYLYGWERLSPRAHFLSGIPIVVAGFASAWFVVTANAWMQNPTGFSVDAAGRVVDVRPWQAILNGSTPVMTTKMILAAYMVTGFGVAAVYAMRMLRGVRDRYHTSAFVLAFSFAAVMTPAQIVAGDWAARHVAKTQPMKLAALEGVYRTQRGAPLVIGGFPIGGEVRGGITIPHGLSLLVDRDPNSEIAGLDQVPPADRPNVALVRTSFQIMVAIGFGLLALVAWFALVLARRKRLPRGSWFPRFAILAGPAAVVALEAGWIVTEVGRQPWIVYRVLRTADAVTASPHIAYGLIALVGVYSALTAATIYAMRRVAHDPLPADEALHALDSRSPG